MCMALFSFIFPFYSHCILTHTRNIHRTRKFHRLHVHLLTHSRTPTHTLMCRYRIFLDEKAHEIENSLTLARSEGKTFFSKTLLLLLLSQLNRNICKGMIQGSVRFFNRQKSQYVHVLHIYGAFIFNICFFFCYNFLSISFSTTVCLLQPTFVDGSK